MNSTAQKREHPGAFVRRRVIPTGMSVKEAAERLDIGRPALSNFLNGNADLSDEMAERLGKAFGADPEELLKMQADFDRQERLVTRKQAAVRPFVPSFLTIKARKIEEWAEKVIEARSHLSVLLRKLVNSTGDDLSRVDFPGYDDAQRRGPDGLVEAGGATPWIPEGKSYWEFGTSQNPKTKADDDYRARTATVDREERATSTFVFVTPRKWPGKGDWEKAKKEAGGWKDVRAFDSSDLEQWLEQSVPAQIWLAEQLGRPVHGYQTLEQAWKDWAHVTDPPLTAELFAPSIESFKSTFESWLNKPSESFFVVAADSPEEALAFLACLFDDEKLHRFKDQAAIFTSPEELKKLVASQVPFIPIVHSEDAERALGAAHHQLHCIVYRPRNAVDTQPDISLDLLSYAAFREALLAMGLEDDDIGRLSRESGRSPTILRRRLSQNAAIRKPKWAGDHDTAKKLVPLALVGAWHTGSEADRELFSSLADRSYETIEDDLTRLLGLDDSPVWAVGQHRGVASKIDSLYAVAPAVTPTDLDRFFKVAKDVLAEDDPALDLPEEKRWAALMYGKKREHSDALRTGICETLVLLSVHGNNLFQDRLGSNLEDRVASLVRSLLTPLTLEKIQSQDGELPRYAEAAPDEFLGIIERDLSTDPPVVLGLLKPVKNDFFGASPMYVSLLRALECLAWRSEYLLRVSLILARLSRQSINDGWGNKPSHSLLSIYRSWMPQTAASVDQRFEALEAISQRFPEIAWGICHAQIKLDSRVGDSSYKPRWRSDATGAGRRVPKGERYEFEQRVLDFLLAWESHDEKKLGDLVECVAGMSEEDERKVWALVQEWASTADEPAKAKLRERIRRFALGPRSHHRKLDPLTVDRARLVYDELRPDDPVTRHGWLFANQHVEVLADEVETERFDWQKNKEKLDELRREAIDEIWSEQGFEGIEELLAESAAANIVGVYAESCITETEPRAHFIHRCLSLGGDLKAKARDCLELFLSRMEENERSGILTTVADSLPEEERIRLFICAPFKAATWRLLEDSYGEEAFCKYWKEVAPSWRGHTPAERTELMDRLLEAGRPRAAFHAVHMDFDEVETSHFKQLLHGIMTVGAEPVDEFKLDSSDISRALDSLDGRPGVTRSEMAHIEFFFFKALERSEHGIPNLERQITETPAAFVQALALLYKRSDGGEDPPEWRIDNPEQHKSIANVVFELLAQIRRIPGTREDGTIDGEELDEWTTEVRRLCQVYGRVDPGDYHLGQLFARAEEREREVWPCPEICEVMESIASSALGKGFHAGIYNSRGTLRGEGGGRDRQRAEKYRNMAEQLLFKYPYVGGILERLAKSYETQGEWMDTYAKVRSRLEY